MFREFLFILLSSIYILDVFAYRRLDINYQIEPLKSNSYVDCMVKISEMKTAMNLTRDDFRRLIFSRNRWKRKNALLELIFCGENNLFTRIVHKYIPWDYLRFFLRRKALRAIDDCILSGYKDYAKLEDFIYDLQNLKEDIEGMQALFIDKVRMTRNSPKNQRKKLNYSIDIWNNFIQNGLRSKLNYNLDIIHSCIEAQKERECRGSA